jgi:hypothetical protein
MASLLLNERVEASGPIELIEQIVTAHDWPYDRRNDDEMTVFVAGNWSEYSLHFAWNQNAADAFGGLQFVCAFDGRVPDGSHAGMYKLLALINAQMWLGHFDIAPEESLLMYRHGVLLPDRVGATAEQCENLIEIALTECDRYYQAFQFVLWGGKTPEEAMASALFETVGEA